MSTDITVKNIFRSTIVHTGKLIRWIVASLFILYLISGIYVISSNEAGILLRFGKVVDRNVPSGIHFSFPWPVDRIIKVPIRIIKRVDIDHFYSTGTNAEFFSLWTGLESYCLTGDNNIVNIQSIIQFNITDPYAYLFRANKQMLLLENMACNAIINSLARIPVDEALTFGKHKIAHTIKTALQKKLDNIGSGLSITFVELRDLKPPDRIAESFSDVVTAKVDREKMIHDAESYYNEEIPKAQAEATDMIESALGYQKEVILKARGKSERFNRLLTEVRKNGDAARRMMHIHTMKEIIQEVENKHIVTVDKNREAPANLRLNFLP